MPDRGIAAARELGLDLSEHRSEQLRLEKLAGVDLVLGMSRRHGREVVAALPALWPRAFTLKQFSRFVSGKDVSRRAELASWIQDQAEIESRSRGELLGQAAQDDIADPLRASLPTWRQVLQEIRYHVTQVLDHCAPLLHADNDYRN
jgi:protein-tyrosine-phosphatase